MFRRACVPPPFIASEEAARLRRQAPAWRPLFGSGEPVGGMNNQLRPLTGDGMPFFFFFFFLQNTFSLGAWAKALQAPKIFWSTLCSPIVIGCAPESETFDRCTKVA